MANDPESLSTINGDLPFPKQWTVFAPIKRNETFPAPEGDNEIPDAITIDGRAVTGRTGIPERGQLDLRPFMDDSDACHFGEAACVMVKLDVPDDMTATFGLGWNNWVTVWLNGEEIMPETETTPNLWPPRVDNHLFDVRLKKGVNILAVRIDAGTAPLVVALGGPNELRGGDHRSILAEPFNYDPRWTSADLRTNTGDKPVVDIGSRLELFVDEFLIDAMSDAVEHRLCHPVPREAVMRFGEEGEPWEGNTGYATIIQDDDRILLVYSGRPSVVTDESEEQYTCLAESVDGINFTRPKLGLFEFNGSKENNIIWRGVPSHNFAPFKDPNPNCQEDQRFKAIAYHVDGKGLGAYASPDCVHWRTLTDKRIIFREGCHFDSQNLAFWDPNRNQYVCYFRNNIGGKRRIMRRVSDDFVTWTDQIELEYNDDRMEQMYTNCIRPYFRAPHIYIGTPARYIPNRKKVPGHPNTSISDAVLIASRDGKFFERWEEAFVRPGPEPEVWTDRNNYPTWGMPQTSPKEISMYWGEHNKHPVKRLRRGTLRLDGFASLHAGGAVGEALTRPLTFSGGRLLINYATSAVGSIRFEFCDQNGETLDGFSFRDCEIVFGNEIEHQVEWFGGRSPAELAGTPVRMRIRLHDADLYSLRFAE